MADPSYPGEEPGEAEGVLRTIHVPAGVITELIPEEVLYDLAKSGLAPPDMKIRPLGNPERAACLCGLATRGYIIPYFDHSGNPTDFYRVKVLNPEMERGAKYKQPHRTSNQVYFPINFRQTLSKWCQNHNDHRLIVITEGEKKAVAAAKLGIPCVGLGGVSNWKTRNLELNASETELYQRPNQRQDGRKITARLHNMDKDKYYEVLNQLAVGMTTVKALANEYNCKLIIVFDSDHEGELKEEVQLAAASLGYGLKRMGMISSRIKLLILPDVAGTSEGEEEGRGKGKTGIDDYIQSVGPKPLVQLLTKACDEPSGFPRMPDVRGYLSTTLNYQNNRETLDQAATVLLCELDALGTRMHERSSGRPYYFYRPENRLMGAEIISRGEVLANTDFGRQLYKMFGLNAADQKLLMHLASQFTGEAPITEVTPRRVRCLITDQEDPLNPRGVAYQATDGKYFSISPSPSAPVRLVDNGTNGILFEQNQVEPLDYDRTMDYFDEFIRSTPPLDPWWFKVLEDTNLGRVLKAPEELMQITPSTTPNPADTERMRQYAALLFYLSPWLHRWNGLQLPVELMLGEAGSGKSSIYNLRLQILTGRPTLRNVPKDLKDWNASITSNGGLIAYDNVHFAKNSLKQEISDEVCRLITEPDPHVELRRLYTTADLQRLPVDATFAFTAIQQPFQNSDFFQRSAVFELLKDDKGYQGSWVTNKLEEYGGREAWVAHHLVFIHRFLRRAAAEAEQWGQAESRDQRLAHLEACLRIAGEVLGMPHQEVASIGRTITRVQNKSFLEADWTFGAIKRFCDEYREAMPVDPNDKFSASTISDWAVKQIDLTDNGVVTNPRKLGNYLVSHQSRLKKDVGLKLLSRYGNSYRYRVMSVEEMEYDEHLEATAAYKANTDYPAYKPPHG